MKNTWPTPDSLKTGVGKWHHAYNALVIERNSLVCRLLKHENTIAIKNEDGLELVTLTRETFDAFSSELEELRKHEVEWGLSKARVKELETEIRQLKGDNK